MSEVEEYFYKKNMIESIKTKLYDLGYKYDSRHGWYNSAKRPLNESQKETVRVGIENFKKHVDRVNELFKKLHIGG